MKLASFIVAAGVASVLAFVGSNSAKAGATCPTVGSVADCNLIVTFGPAGAITTSGPGGNYDGAEDSLIGVVNNSGHTLTGFNVSSTNPIFAFDSDGISTYVPAATDPSGYAGPDNTFTITDYYSGSVNFPGGLANGASTYFSLEYGIDLSNPPNFTPAPEPMGLALIGVGLLALGATRVRRA